MILTIRFSSVDYICSTKLSNNNNIIDGGFGLYYDGNECLILKNSGYIFTFLLLFWQLW